MESTSALLGALIFIGMVLGANLVMYALARSATRSGNKGFLETLSQSLKNSSHKKDDSMDELRRRIQELNHGKREDSGDSE